MGADWRGYFRFYPRQSRQTGVYPRPIFDSARITLLFVTPLINHFELSGLQQTWAYLKDEALVRA
jgi:hypothetical protein